VQAAPAGIFDLHAAGSFVARAFARRAHALGNKARASLSSAPD
jgi:hypothetical protein